MTHLNPFFYGPPAQGEQFFPRRQETRRIVGRLLNQGQSSALSGEPRSGKTSLLHYLMAPGARRDLYGDAGDSLVFSYLDAQALSEQFAPPDFWQRLLQPLESRALSSGAPAALVEACTACRAEGYNAFTLERLLAQMQAEGWHLALLLDEFDAFLAHPRLHKAEFYGGLRMLASRYSQALTLVIASRQSLQALNYATQEYSGCGSPYFNIFEEIVLAPLSNRAVGQLLARGAAFTPQERRELGRLCGGHPYLLQAAASALWEAHADGESDPARRLHSAGKALLAQAAPSLADTWRLWTPEIKRAFIIIALDNAPRLLGEERCYDLDALLPTLPDCEGETRFLEQRGYIASDPTLPGGWQVTAEVVLHWLSGELLAAMRRGDELGGWLNAQGWEGLFTRGEKAQLVKAVAGLGSLLKSGAETFIKIVAEGATKGLGRG